MSRKVDKKLKTNIKRAKFTHLYHHSPVSEQFRTLRTNINLLGNSTSTLVITSPNSEEGKTTTVVNLSIVLAQQGKKVLLVDANLRKPSLHKLFDLSNSYGLSNYLSNLSSLGSAIHDSGIYHLDILPSGPVPHNPTELLASDRMKEFVNHMEKEYDIILFDTPPILNYSDAQLIGNLCNSVVLVFKSNHTSKDSAVKAKEMLLNTNARILGALLNEA